MRGDGRRLQTDGCISSADLDHRQRVGPKLPAAHHLPRSVRTKSDRAGRWRQPQPVRASVPPEIAVEAARKRVEEIEAALGALAAVGTIDGPEVHVLKDCPSKAKRSAQERPLVQQISQTELYLERARKRLTAHDETRQALVTDVEEHEVRLERLRTAAIAAESVPLPRSSSEQVQNLQQMVNQLQEERDALEREFQGAPVERPKVRQRLSHAYGAVERCREDVRDDRRQDVLIDGSRGRTAGTGCEACELGRRRTLDRPEVRDRLRAEM